MRWQSVLALVAIQAGSLHAQLDLLTLRAAEGIVERIPAVAEAKRQGQCPELSATYWEAAHFWFQVRSSCGSTGGMLIGDYDLDRRTGNVRLWGDNPLPADGAESKELARRLVQEARGRILSASEAKCLALEAARSLPGWSGAGSTVIVRPFGKIQHETMRFAAEHSLSRRLATSGRMLTVNLTTARVRDDESSADLMSEGLGLLTSRIISLRSPLWLSDEDAISMVLLVPAMASRLRDGCKLAAGGAFRSTEALVGLSCEGQSGDGLTVAVNLQNGNVTDADTGRILESPEAARLAAELLEGLKRRRFELQEEVSKACRIE